MFEIACRKRKKLKFSLLCLTTPRRKCHTRYCCWTHKNRFQLRLNVRFWQQKEEPHKRPIDIERSWEIEANKDKGNNRLNPQVIMHNTNGQCVADYRVRCHRYNYINKNFEKKWERKYTILIPASDTWNNFIGNSWWTFLPRKCYLPDRHFLVHLWFLVSVLIA